MTTMILEPPSKTRLGVGLDPNRRSVSGQEPAWKKNIRTKQIPARLAMLPEGESRAKKLGVSAVLQIAFATFIFLSPLLFPHQMSTTLKFLSSEVAMPITTVELAPPPPPPPKAPKLKTPTPEPTPAEPPKLNPQQPHIFMTPKAVVQPKRENVEAKAPVIENTFEAAKIDVQSNQPKRPKEEVKTGMMSSGNATPATVKAPVEKVQTGGFGDPTGLPGKGNANA